MGELTKTIKKKNGSTTLSPASDVLLDVEQQTPHFQDARRKARLFVPEEGCQNPEMWRHRRQAPGYQAGPSHGVEEHASDTSVCREPMVETFAPPPSGKGSSGRS